MEERTARNKKKIFIIIGISFAVLVAILCVGLYVHSTSPAVRLQHQLNLGNKYLDELDYAQAIAAFDAAIEIDPMNGDAYKGLIRGYSGLDDEDGLFDTYSRFTSSLDDDMKNQLSVMTADEMSRMTEQAIASENYDKAEHILIYLSSIDIEKTDELQVLLNNSMCESLGHEWAVATCSEPRHCTRCGLTEGNPLEHIPTEADYWNPSVCELCGAELGPVVTPGFEELGYTSMQLCHEYTYNTVTPGGNLVSGRASIVSYKVLEESETWNGSWYTDDTYELTEREGYEWRCVKIKIQYTSIRVGCGVSWCLSPDFYYLSSKDNIGDNSKWAPDGIDESEVAVDYLGEEYECKIVLSQGNSGYINQSYLGADVTFDISYAIQVPIGYDGFVLMLFNRNDHNEELFSNALYFHFD